MNRIALTIVLLTGVLLTIVSCSDEKRPNVELIQDMMETESIKTQEGDASNPHGRAMRVPPKGTVPRGFTPYKYKDNIEGANRNKNPLRGKMTPQILKRGRKYYEIACAVCHGHTGKGDGTVSKKWPLPMPKLISKKVRNYTDGRIYHVISEGQGLMGSYRNIVPAEFRWELVNYVRNLQKQNSEE